MTRLTSVPTKPTSSEIRPPHSARANASRPSSSVPNQCASDGGVALSLRSWSVGSASPGIQGAMSAASDSSVRNTADSTATRFRRSRFHASRHRLAGRAQARAPPPGPPAGGGAGEEAYEGGQNGRPGHPRAAGPLPQRGGERKQRQREHGPKDGAQPEVGNRPPPQRQRHGRMIGGGVLVPRRR